MLLYGEFDSVMNNLLKKLLFIASFFSFQQYSPEIEAKPSDGEIFFNNNVLPELIANECQSCHSKGYIRPNILIYDEFIKRLAIGDSSENNIVIYKIANIRSINPQIPNHPGGQRCLTIEDEPCKTIRQWWEIEFGSNINNE